MPPTASSRRPGLQNHWKHVVDSLESIIPIYERGSARIAFFGDAAMRDEVVRSAVRSGEISLDLGSGPGTLARRVAANRGVPVLTDVSRTMLRRAGPYENKIQCVFENLPLRGGSLSSAVAGFALRDSRDLVTAVSEIRRVLVKGGRFSFCDLGRPSSRVRALLLGLYIFVVVPVIGLATGGRKGLAFASLYRTYLLTLDNDVLVKLLQRYFVSVKLHARQMGGAIVVECTS